MALWGVILCAGALVLIPALAEWIQADRLGASERTRAEEAERDEPDEEVEEHNLPGPAAGPYKQGQPRQQQQPQHKHHRKGKGVGGKSKGSPKGKIKNPTAKYKPSPKDTFPGSTERLANLDALATFDTSSMLQLLRERGVIRRCMCIVDMRIFGAEVGS